MPIYEYQCEECEKRTEAIQRLDDPPLDLCPHCGGPLRKLMSAPAFQFKGSGWYVTDYADKGKKDSRSSGGKTQSKTSSSDADSSKNSSETKSSGTGSSETGSSSKAGDSS